MHPMLRPSLHLRPTAPVRAPGTPLPALVFLLALPLASAPAADLFSGVQNLITSQASGALSVFAADLDGDGDPDALSASGFDDKVAWYENVDGLGTFGPQQVISSSADEASAVFAADLDGDLDLDVISASSADDTVAWYENTDGMGAFGPAQVIDGAADGAFNVFAVDLDGDLDVDVLSGSTLTGTIAWYENTDGMGTFGPAQTVTTLADFIQSLHAADLDGDGDADVLSASAFDDKIAWYENTDGLGTFGAQQVLTSAIDSAQSVFAADLDGDGDRDVVAGWFNDGLGWFENTDGLGSFAFQALISTAAAGVEMVAAADLDGDGDADVLSASAFDDKFAWYENTDGLGTFGPQQVITTEADFAQSVAPADVDGDGDLDVLGASLLDGEVAWYENGSCSGAVAAAEVVRLGTPPNPAAFLPGVTSGPVLCATWDPVIDHTTFLPGAVLDFVGITASPTNVPLGALGTVLCDAFTQPLLLFQSPPGVPFALPIPGNCNLVGKSFCAQGISTDGLLTRLANALDVTVGTF